MNLVQTRRLTQEMADTYQRALTGGAFYAAAWLLVGLYGNAFSHAPLASWFLLLSFIGLAASRFIHRPLPEGAQAPALKRWLRVHWGIVLVTTLMWGVLFFWATFDPAFGSARITALLFTLGLATAIAHAFSMRRGFAFACIALLCLPGLLLLWSNPADRVNGLMMAIYLVYVVISLLRSYIEYQQRLDLDQELRSQRDLFSRQSRIDPLTELANRRQFADVLEAATERSRRSEPLSLLLLDIDHFKQINDTYGHTIGDACLMAIAARLKSSFSGPGDLAARVGGEEFGVILDGQDLATATERAERFRASLAEHPIAPDGIVLVMTASIGVAEFDSGLHKDDDGLYHAADSAVYRAKAGGRNRVCCEEASLALARDRL
ncbi:MAG: GGDEF domain-containing protein [Pseudoxanthomonas sp.]